MHKCLIHSGIKSFVAKLNDIFIIKIINDFLKTVSLIMENMENNDYWRVDPGLEKIEHRLFCNQGNASDLIWEIMSSYFRGKK